MFQVNEDILETPIKAGDREGWFIAGNRKSEMADPSAAVTNGGPGDEQMADNSILYQSLQSDVNNNNNNNSILYQSLMSDAPEKLNPMHGAMWFKGTQDGAGQKVQQPQVQQQQGWFRGQPAPNASDAEIAGWFRGQPPSVTATDVVVIADPATAGWFRAHPAPNASNAEIAGWFRGQPASVAADAASAAWFRGQPPNTASNEELVGWFRRQPLTW